MLRNRKTGGVYKVRIDIVSDTICPWCYIGKRRLERALNAGPSPIDAEIGWHSFQLNPDMPSAGMERDAYLDAKFGGVQRARRQYGVIGKAGREEGIEFRFDLIRHTPNTVESHRLVHYSGLHGCQDAVMEALFRAYLIEGRNIGDLRELVEIGVEAGLERAVVLRYLESDRDTGFILGEDERIRNLGVSGVPCFVVERRYAVSGAQSPEVFRQIFDLVREERKSPAAAE